MVHPTLSFPACRIYSHPRFFQGRSPSDVSDVETTFSEDKPTPKPTPKMQRIVVAQKGPAAVHPAQRRGSMMPLKSQLGHSVGSSGGGSGGGGARRRDSIRSEPGRGWDVPDGVISEVEVAGEGDRDLWTWKEPPVLRKLGASSGGSSSSLSRNASSRGRGITALSETEPAATDGRPRRLESARSLGRTVRRSSSELAPPAGRRERSNSDSPGDFWNPLGLMPEDAQPAAGRGLRRGTPLSAAPSHGGRGAAAKEASPRHSAGAKAGEMPSSGRGSKGALRRGTPLDERRAPGGKRQGAEGSSQPLAKKEAPDNAE